MYLGLVSGKAGRPGLKFSSKIYLTSHDLLNWIYCQILLEISFNF